MHNCDLLLLALVGCPRNREDLFRHLGETLGSSMMYASAHERSPFQRDVEQLIHEGLVNDTAQGLTLTDAGKGHIAYDPVCAFIARQMLALLQEKATGQAA